MQEDSISDTPELIELEEIQRDEEDVAREQYRDFVDSDGFLTTDSMLVLLKEEFNDLCLVAGLCSELEDIDGKLFSITALGVALTNLVIFIVFFDTTVAGVNGFVIVIVLLCFSILFAFGGLFCEWVNKRNSVAYNKGVIEMKSRLESLRDNKQSDILHHQRLASVYEHYKGHASHYAPHQKLDPRNHDEPYEEVGKPGKHDFHKLHYWWSNADARSRYTVYELRQWGVALRRWILVMKVNIALSIVCQGASQALISSISAK